MSADLEVQRALRALLVASPAVTALVPPEAILDANQRPAPRPSIVLGETSVAERGEDIHRRRRLVAHTLHIWTREPGTVAAKAVMGAIEVALDRARPAMNGWHCIDLSIPLIRVLRDPDGETAHGVMSVEAMVEADP